MTVRSANLVDQYGRPIAPAVKTSGLTKEQSTGSIMSVRSPYDPIVAIGLTPQRLIQLLQSAKDGNHFDYLALAAEMEKRDPHYFSVLQTRKLALTGLERNIESVGEDAQSTKEAQAVGDLVNTAEFGIALLNIADAIAKGYSVTEIIWYKRPDMWVPACLKWRNPRWFQFDKDTAEELHLYDGTMDGQKLDPFKYIIHKPHVFSGSALGGGLARIVAAYHMFKSFAIRDWMSFAEVFGIPIRIGKYTSAATEEHIGILKAAVAAIGSDAAAVIPDTMSIDFERAAQSGFAGSDSLFRGMTDFFNKEVSKAVLGQTMTSEDGSSLAQAKVHENVRIDITKSDAWQIANTINRDLIQPFIALNFGVRERQQDYPQFVLDTSEPEDLALLATSLPPFIDRGLEVSAKDIREKFGLQEPVAGEQLLDPVVKATTPSGDDDEDGDPEEGSPDENLKYVLDQVRTGTNLRVLKAKLDKFLTKT